MAYVDIYGANGYLELEQFKLPKGASFSQLESHFSAHLKSLEPRDLRRIFPNSVAEANSILIYKLGGTKVARDELFYYVATKLSQNLK